ncbi:MAG: metal-dependent hydrolase [Nanobdellota archaeon]
MLFKTHLAFSFFLFMLLWPLMPVSVSKWVFAVIWLFFSVFPDIDLASSKIGRFFRPFGWIFRHRGFFHSFLAAIVFTLLIGFFAFDYTYAVFFGYVSHLFLDMFNHQGIAPFFPFSRFRFKGSVKAGGVLEAFVFLLSFIGIIVLSF